MVSYLKYPSYRSDGSVSLYWRFLPRLHDPSTDAQHLMKQSKNNWFRLAIFISEVVEILLPTLCEQPDPDYFITFFISTSLFLWNFRCGTFVLFSIVVGNGIESEVKAENLLLHYPERLSVHSIASLLWVLRLNHTCKILAS